VPYLESVLIKVPWQPSGSDLSIGELNSKLMEEGEIAIVGILLRFAMPITVTPYGSRVYGPGYFFYKVILEADLAGVVYFH
jgi:hypothetical protein